MPLYDFRCTQCEHQFTVRASFKEKDAELKPECPACHELETQQVLTSGIFIGQGASSGSGHFGLPVNGPTCGCGSGGCGCG